MASPRLVTPEAVELRFSTASLGSRLLAAGIDLAIQGAVLLVLGLGFGLLAADAGSATAGFVVLLLAVTAIVLGYPIAFETLWRGRTPGKAALGLRVVAADGSPLRFRHAVVRGFLTLVDVWLTSGVAAVLAILFTRDDQRLGDLAAGTLVIRERTGAGAPEAMRFEVPPGWEGYAATIDVAGMGADDYGAARSALSRAPSLPPDVRGRLLAEVASIVAGRVGHVPPPGVPPEAFLTCAAARYQQRAAPVTGADPLATRSGDPLAPGSAGGAR
jgi:uncharacterized RDD family membrane protein YckC